VIAPAAELGLFGCVIPQEWGGLGLDLTQDVEHAGVQYCRAARHVRSRPPGGRLACGLSSGT
jgi:alkylation response protein AidB-like acyl-CoA dehydrogenase